MLQNVFFYCIEELPEQELALITGAGSSRAGIQSGSPSFDSQEAISLPVDPLIPSGGQFMLNHTMIGSNDIQRTKAFYDAVLSVLGAGPAMEHVNDTGQTRLFYIHDGSTFGISEPH